MNFQMNCQTRYSLLSGELMLCISGLYHLMNGWTGPGSHINFSDIRIVMPA